MLLLMCDNTFYKGHTSHLKSSSSDSVTSFFILNKHQKVHTVSLCVMTPCCLVGGYQHFRATYCSHLQGTYITMPTWWCYAVAKTREYAVQSN